MKTWNGEDLEGEWEVSRKIDGVCVIVKPDGAIVSRRDKPLYNMGHLKLKPGRYEVFLGSWEETVSAVRASKHVRVVDKHHLYCLDPIDPRLFDGVITNPKKRALHAGLNQVVKRGYEGLVLRQGDKYLKLKPKNTYDVPITDWIEGKGKHKGRMGALMTPKGKVGTGFTDGHRETMTKHCIGNIIEVESMGLTPKGKFRHPRFLRVRFDK